MDIVSKRILRGKATAVSMVTVNGIFHSYMLEDQDRGLHSGMDLAEIRRIKVHGKTAIPEGRYLVQINMSPRFKRMLPQICEVPGFSGIRLHPGNKKEDTEGCPLPGMRYVKVGNDYVVELSRRAFEPLEEMIAVAIERGEKVWYTVTSQYEK